MYLDIYLCRHVNMILYIYMYIRYGMYIKKMPKGLQDWSYFVLIASFCTEKILWKSKTGKKSYEKQSTR